MSTPFPVITTLPDVADQRVVGFVVDIPGGAPQGACFGISYRCVDAVAQNLFAVGTLELAVGLEKPVVATLVDLGMLELATGLAEPAAVAEDPEPRVPAAIVDAYDCPDTSGIREDLQARVRGTLEDASA